jgi:hypothetical protein
VSSFNEALLTMGIGGKYQLTLAGAVVRLPLPQPVSLPVPPPSAPASCRLPSASHRRFRPAPVITATLARHAEAPP